MVASSSGKSLLFSAGSAPEPGETDRRGVWMLELRDGTGSDLDWIVRGFTSEQPAGAMAIGPASMGTGTSLFLAGNGQIIEIFGRRFSSLFSF